MSRFLIAVCGLGLGVLWGTILPSRAVELSMEGAVQAALMGNRELSAARWEIHKARARLLQSGLLPNPEMEFSGMSDFIAEGNGEGAFTVGFSQKFPVTARLGIAREGRRVEVALAMREIRNRERLLIGQVQTSYVKIQAARSREQAAMAARDRSLSLIELAGKRLLAGQGSLAEGALLRVEERKWAAESVSARTDAETSLIHLKTLLGLDSRAALKLTESVEKIVDQLAKGPTVEGSLRRPDVEAAILEMDRAGYEVRLARAEVWEGIKLGIEYTYDHAVDEPAGLGTNQFLGINVSIPIPVWDTRRGAVDEGIAAREQAGEMVRALELEVANEIAAASRRADLYHDQLKNYRKSTERALEQSENEMSSGFEQGRVELRDLLQVRAQSAALRIDAVDILENLALALIDRQVAAGRHSAVIRDYTEVPGSQTPQKSHSPRKP